MKKINFRTRGASAILVTAFVLELAIPFVGFAAATSTGSATQNFCDRLDTFRTTVANGLTMRVKNIEGGRTDRARNLTEGRTKRNNDLTAGRMRQDLRRNEFYAKLNEKADTDAKKQAIANFKTTMEAAVTARRSAVDAAIQAFQTTVDQSITNRKTGVDIALNALKKSVTTALDKAKSDCQGGVKSSAVRITLRAALKTAREKFKSDRAAVERIGANVSQAAKTKNEAVKKAVSGFKAAAEKARKNLKTALGK